VLWRLSSVPPSMVAVSAARTVLQPLEELLDAGVAAGTFELEDAELSAHALYGAVSMAALSRFARHGYVDADRLLVALVPQLVASVRPVG
jgi:hypothetical protein